MDQEQSNKQVALKQVRPRLQSGKKIQPSNVQVKGLRPGVKLHFKGNNGQFNNANFKSAENASTQDKGKSKETEANQNNNLNMFVQDADIGVNNKNQFQKREKNYNMGAKGVNITTFDTHLIQQDDLLKETPKNTIINNSLAQNSVQQPPVQTINNFSELFQLLNIEFNAQES